MWADPWVGTSPLAIQYWPLYAIRNETSKTISEIWDGAQDKLSFRRNFNDKMMESWYQLEEIVKKITLVDETDSLVWQLDSKGVYSSSSLYHVINFRVVKPVFILVVWKLLVPPKIHIFLWLVSYNKIMTRDNLRKRHIIKPLDCVFCSSEKSIQHLFFYCVVAKIIWSLVRDHFKKDIGSDYLSMAEFWVSNKKNVALNVAISTTMWYL